MLKQSHPHAYLEVKDHSVSGESFQLVLNSKWDYLETHPKPDMDTLADYYESEDYISHTDASRNPLEKVYQIVKSVSLKRKLKLINSVSNFKVDAQPSEEKKLLDVGCGTGDFLKTAKDNQWHITGIEPNEKARSIAIDKCGKAILDTDALSKLPPQHFDVITLWHVLEHLPNLQDQLALFVGLLKPKGTLIIAVPNYNSYDAKHYKQFWAAFDVPRHLWHFSQEAINRLLLANNMKVINTKPMVFDAFYVALLSEKYKSGTMNAFKAFWQGLKSNWKATTSSEYSSLIYIAKMNNNAK
ncbi:class I SAM-dependent methyltransferase [Subsaximicrobium wynnwilliamsii]|uniref:Class I SAM-dependent methyltransferase n=1 Tax=Subsaximicrobium wynnwilliamsii TaxID=291179 RepID=A0A5C6ZM19_9FLAO|nr:class I SAM-dependent methyltransferase [Subsaximicrobium wynnwilliamsii]TXD83984.1 class I SAM-dependent methyltransferase [Subsaximicrobium wynnwilliamsii]TXD89724.1 class I SAM-dependent methyltransferase [Subsaximicrobium wynnwilliamsii]TXE01709.1 class I SAM-dependent methyltransferase [Subsaximicrobium wynnwilliamsii]